MNIKDSFSTLPNELVSEIIIPKFDLKAYAALSCCTKRFNEIAKEYSIIAWPVKVTIIKELTDVSFALHHVGCDILAIEGKRNGLIFDLTNGKQIANVHVMEAYEKRQLELGLNFGFKSFYFDDETDCTIGFTTDSTNYYARYVKFNLAKKYINNKDSQFIYSKKNGYLIYEVNKDIHVLDVKTETKIFSCTLRQNERVIKLVYNENEDHLVFSSRFSSPKNLASVTQFLYISIYDIKTKELLQYFPMNNISSCMFQDPLLYLPEKKLVITCNCVSSRNDSGYGSFERIYNIYYECMIYDLTSEKIVRTIPLRDFFNITQLSFKNNSLYITQLGSNTKDTKPNCVISRIDFCKTLPIETQDNEETNDCACTIL